MAIRAHIAVVAAGLVMTWSGGLLSCYPEDPSDDDTTGIPADDDTTASDDDTTDDDDSADDDSADDDTEPFGDQDHDGYTVEDGDCDDTNPDLNLDDNDGDGYTTCDGDCDDDDADLDLDDADGDGQSPCDGDCDDDNGAVLAGAEDICDELDNDCDGEVNEDTPGAADPYEPNDTSAHELGDMTDQETTIEAYIGIPGDQDIFQFSVEDSVLSDVYIEFDLHTVPAGLNLALELFLFENASGQYVGQSLALIDDGGLGQGEYLYWSGDFWADDTGTYEVAVTASWGYECDLPYTIAVAVNG